ncbi:MAG TPA: helix-turn-helix domain-containing protein [Solirubrobacteraceae bacterium]|nr:helix-turn-helix domain-containing protein [Solirubrobacteraceae bacterium]
MLDWAPSRQRVSTGIDALDGVLGGLYWGDNVVWQLDAAKVDLFYAAIAGLPGEFETRVYVSLGPGAGRAGLQEIDLLSAGPGTAIVQPGDLLQEIYRRCQPVGRRLLLFDSLDSMVAAWGANQARGFFSRCCPMLLELEAIAYWAMGTRSTPAAVRDTVEAVTQCVLQVDERSVRVVKAEGRSDGVKGSVMHWHEEAGRPVLAPAELVGRVAASLRAVRRTRELSQHELAGLAGVTASAISQAERAERGLSLSTLVRLSSALGCTVDDLLRGEDPEVYRIGRRVEDPEGDPEPTINLLGDPQSGLRADLIHLRPREAGAPAPGGSGQAIIAVASGLVQITVSGQTPAVRHGEVLVADSERVEGWRNLGQTDATLFWIVYSAA